MANPIAKAPDGSLVDFSQVISIGRLYPDDSQNLTNLTFKFYIYFMPNDENARETIKHTFLLNNISLNSEKPSNLDELLNIRQKHKTIYNKRWSRFMAAWKRYREHVAFIRENY